VTETVQNDAVAVTLELGAWRAHWRDPDTAAGPFTAHIELTSGTRHSDGVGGSWQFEPGDGYGRPGTWARWQPDGDAPMIRLHVPDRGPVVVVAVDYRPSSRTLLDTIVVASGPLELGVDRVLVDGYDSWAYAGVRRLPDKGRSYWDATFVDGSGGAVAFQALSAERFCTSIGWSGVHVLVDAGATPVSRAVDGTWGYSLDEGGPLHLPVTPEDEVRSEVVAVAAGTEPLALLEDLAELAGRTSGRRRWSGAPVHGWESWYHYGLLIGRDQLLANARELMARNRRRPGFDLVQLDDGWQVTYGAWWSNDRFPDNLGELTEELRSLGARPGLWLAPFMVQPGAPGIAADHPDWAITDEEGAPRLDRYGRWGIDASHPNAVDWLHDLGAQVRAWDFEMVKLDFLYLGAVEGGRHDDTVTGTDALRRGVRAMVDGLGDDRYVLACGSPLLPVVGLAHGNRVGHDLGIPVLLREFGHPAPEWTGFHGVRAQARNVAARFALHRRWFEADPDVVMAGGSDRPPTEGGYTVEEARTLATLAALCGGPFLWADKLAALSAGERAVLEHPGLLDLIGGDGFRPVDLFDVVDEPAVEQFFAQPTALASMWRAERNERAVVALFNWSDERATRAVPDDFVGAPELWTGAVAGDQGIAIPPHAVRVFTT